MLLQAGEVNASVGFDGTTKGWARKHVGRRAKGEEQRAKGYTLLALALCPCALLFALGPLLFAPGFFSLRPLSLVHSGWAMKEEDRSVALTRHLFE